jgi:drug/metabolite transporter (DMT)-like permease
MAKGGGFLFCAAAWSLCFGAPSLSWKRLRNVAVVAYPVAICDICDTVLATGGIVWAKSGLFVIAFSSITVWVALLRRLCLKQRLSWNKWCSVVAITLAIGASGAQSIDVKSDIVLRVIGVAATLIAAFADACMYIFVEKLLKNNEKVLEDEELNALRKVSPFELLTFVGIISTIFSFVWIFTFFIGGWWVEDISIIIGCGFPNSTSSGTSSSTSSGTTLVYYLVLWSILGIIGFGVHYVSFFYLVKHENCLTASVSKASQSAIIFFLSSVFFCSRSNAQCLSTLKVVCAAVVCLSVVLYSAPVQKKVSCIG